MKLTKEALIKVIKEEIDKLLKEEPIESQADKEEDASETLEEIESSEEERVAGRTRNQEHSEDEHTMLEVTPKGFENVVKGIKKSVSKGDTPETYKTSSGKTKETNPWADRKSVV